MRDTGQLPLDLALEPRFGAEDFLVSQSNTDAYGRIETWPDWPGHMLAVAGPVACGKSHLTAIWAVRAGARVLSARALSKADLPALAAAGALAVEDADKGNLPEAELFHLLNLMLEKKSSLLITGTTPPARWPVRTPDLASRLRKMPSVSIDPPDDALLRALLVKLFVDRQLVVDLALVEYLVVRIERSFSAVSETVNLLDRESLARGRRLTRAVASRILGFSEEND
jgi:chromosomal replication initiation ATPase DnaA